MSVSVISRPAPSSRVGRYELGARLGAGSFGTVRAARHLDTRSRAAIKMIDVEAARRDGSLHHINREIAILTLVRHVHVSVMVLRRSTS